MDEREILSRIIPYVPPYWVRQALSDPAHTLAGREERIFAAVLFVDISGFTPMTEALSQQGREGVEELSAILDRYFTRMSEPVLDLGGDVVKFAGDALIVAFLIQPDLGDAHLGSAIECALRMQAAMDEFASVHTSAGDFPLRMKIGISEGAIYNTTIGSEEGEMQPVFAGLPLARCQQAEDHAAAGEIVVDAGVARRIPGRLEIGEARGTFRLILGGRNLSVLPPVCPIDVSSLQNGQAAELLERLKPYLSAQLVQRIQQGQIGVYGEHRLVTVMFVKFGGLNYDWEPQVGEALQIYFSVIQGCVARYGGRLNEVDIGSSGGTLVIFFGAPTAYEDNELRAVSCAWEMQQAISQVRMRAGGAAQNLQQSIGVSTGTLFVGDVGGPLRRVYAAVGDEVNLAARLMDLAEWGEVVVTRQIQKRSVSRFEFESMGEVKLKGKTEPVPMFALLAPKMDSPDDHIASQWTETGLLFGRVEEVTAMRAVQESAWQGVPHLLLLSGEAGIGKSRLLAETVHSWRARGGMALVGDCRVQGSHLDYMPWVRILYSAFGIQQSDPTERRREKLESQLVMLSPELARDADMFFDLLGLQPVGGELSSETLFLPQRQHVRRHRSVMGLVRAFARRQPLLLALENVQDADDASLALLNDLLHEIDALALLVCVVYRPVPVLAIDLEAVPSTEMLIGPLGEGDLEALAAQRLQEAGLNPDLAPQIVARAQGNPLYLQQLVHIMAESGNENIPPDYLAVPEGIPELIQSQIDRLDEDTKLTLRVAAVIGTTFALDVLQHAHPSSISMPALLAQLAVLERMQLICPVSAEEAPTSDQATYAFVQAMVRQVIYDRLLSADRERFHRRVAEALEAVYQVDLLPFFEPLAEHFERARIPGKAAFYWHKAGRRVAEAGDIQRALEHYTRACTTLDECVPAPQYEIVPEQVRLELLIDRAQVYETLLDSTGALDDYGRAFQLATAQGRPDLQGDVLLRTGQIAFDQARYPDTLYYTRQAIQRFSTLHDRAALSRSLDLITRTHLEQGHPDAVEQDVLQILQFAPGTETEIESQILQGQIWYRTGYLDRAIDVLQMVLSQKKIDSMSQARIKALGYLALVLLARGRWGQAIELASEAVDLGRSESDLDLAQAYCFWGQVLTQVGDYVEACACLGAAVDTFTRARSWLRLQDALWALGEALLAQGQCEAANEWFLQALALARESHTVHILVRAQLGMSKLAAIDRDWAEEQRLCAEARALARRAGLQLLTVEARLGLARAYLGRRTWKPAQREALLARDKSFQLRWPYNLFRAEAMLGEALVGLESPQRAEQHFQEARSMILRLVDTLPESYRPIFVNRPYVQVILNPSGAETWA